MDLLLLVQTAWWKKRRTHKIQFIIQMGTVDESKLLVPR